MTRIGLGCLKKSSALGGFALTAALLLAFPGAALATGGSVTIGGGNLTMAVPLAVAFTGTLNGTDQTLVATQDLTVSDFTGIFPGWNVTLTTTQFSTAGGALLAANAASDLGYTSTCGSADPVDCDPLLPDSAAVVAIPAALPLAPTAVIIEDAGIGAGAGGPSVYTHVMNLAVAANALNDNYLSTWTYSINSGP